MTKLPHQQKLTLQIIESGVFELTAIPLDRDDPHDLGAYANFEYGTSIFLAFL